VQRAAITLAEKQVPFRRTIIDLANKPAWFVELSPLGKTPLLCVSRPGEADAMLFESAVICEYIEETQPSPQLHPADPLERAQHRAWMEFGSAILVDIWGLETARDPKTFETKRIATAEKFARVEPALGDGPYFAGKRVSLVDAVFAPIFRYFDLFDTLTELHVFANTPKVSAWRIALAERPSVREAVAPDYVDRLRAFLVQQDAYLLKQAA